MPRPASSKVIPIKPLSAAGTQKAAASLFESQARIHPRSVSGVFARWRWVMVWVTQAVFYGMPWLQWNGRQAVLFDLLERRFFVFGLVLQPQDLIYLAALLVLSALALFFFTAVAGRLWCGYSCPQTVYTEIFLWVERRLEGDRVARMRLDDAPWGATKLARRGGKHLAWMAIALVTGFTFVGYFTPIRALLADTVALRLSSWEAFWVLFYGAATYGNAGYLREQVCKFMCPYARFQSALIDGDSLVITYDTARGEPRGSRSRKADPRALGLGDCVDCTLCVQVCPTGIDIRKGLQNECIGCAACIDVCDSVMERVGYAKGLIRYATGNGVANGWTRAQMVRRTFRPRVLIYGALLLAVASAFTVSLWLRSDFSVNVIRDRSALARVDDSGGVENVYRLQVVNSTEQPRRYRVSVAGLPEVAIATTRDLDVAANAIGTLTVRAALPALHAQALPAGAHTIEFAVTPVATPQEAAHTVRERSTFYVRH
ncbi:MAG TPA: cytochrome c oxidase accessory protein CcoG [Quisquiliibacterium sp.]|nr:cytochrome c oxidase accessory protein CcoG [Quisquiliibacterium sp.]